MFNGIGLILRYDLYQNFTDFNTKKGAGFYDEFTVLETPPLVISTNKPNVLYFIEYSVHFFTLKMML